MMKYETVFYGHTTFIIAYNDFGTMRSVNVIEYTPETGQNTSVNYKSVCSMPDEIRRKFRIAQITKTVCKHSY